MAKSCSWQIQEFFSVILANPGLFSVRENIFSRLLARCWADSPEYHTKFLDGDILNTQTEEDHMEFPQVDLEIDTLIHRSVIHHAQ